MGLTYDVISPRLAQTPRNIGNEVVCSPNKSCGFAHPLSPRAQVLTKSTRKIISSIELKKLIIYLAQ